MVVAARQLCRASTSVATTATVTSCPVCGAKVKPTEHHRVRIEGQLHLRPVIPSHIRNENGEQRVKVQADRTRYPGVGS